MNTHSSLSKAFSRSILMTIVPILLLEVVIVWTISWEMMMLSLAFLSRMKLAWRGWIKLLRWGFSLRTRIFMIAL